MRRGILLAGGGGTRLTPLTKVISKQLLPIYDKPMIYYPLSILMLAEVREILVITTPKDMTNVRTLLGDGNDLGLDLHYAAQPRPEGIAQAYQIGRDFVGAQPSVLVLGDNIFHGHGLVDMLERAAKRLDGATIFACHVADPQRYGIVSFDRNGHANAIEEKPEQPQSNYAVTGLYFYDAKAVEFADTIKPSARGELEITDINRLYLEAGQLNVEMMNRGLTWLDAGTPQTLMDAALYVQIVEKRQSLKVCCPEEIAWRKGFITTDELAKLAARAGDSDYGNYLTRVLENAAT